MLLDKQTKHRFSITHSATRPNEVISPDWAIVNSRMRQGARWIRVLSNYAPDNTFQAAEPDLNDVYFTALLEKTNQEATLS